MKSERLLELSNSVDPELRRQAAVQLATASGASARGALLACLGDENWRVRKQAVESLSQRTDDREEIVSALTRVFEPGDNVGLRNGAVEALGAFGLLAVQTLQKELKGFDSDGRKLAVEALARTNHADALPLLRELLSDEDVNVRAAALEATADLGHVAPEVASGILTTGLALGDPYLSLVSLDALARLDSTVCWETLAPLLDDQMLRGPALQIASRLGDPRAAKPMIEHLQQSRGQTWNVMLTAIARFVNQSNEGMHATADALGDLSEQCLQRLREAAQDCSEAPKCSEALLLLAVKGAAEAAEFAFEHLKHDHLASAAHGALKVMGKDALPTLRAKLRSDCGRERAVSVELIGHVQTAASVDEFLAAELRQLARDPSAQVVRAWLCALQVHATEEDLEPALTWLRDDAPPHVRSAALAFARIGVRRFPARATALVSETSPSSPRAAWAAAFISASEAPLFESTQEDLAFLVAAVSSRSECARAVAIEALAKFDSGAAAEAVAFALNDEVPAVQLTAVRVLGTLGPAKDGRTGTLRLVELAQTSNDPTLVVAALQALGAGQDPTSLDLLSHVALDANAWRAVAALEAIVRFPADVRGNRAAQALIQQRPDVVRTALEAIVAITDAAESELATCLRHPAWGMRCLAAELLAQHTVQPVPSALKEVLRKRLSEEDRGEVRAAIERTLAVFESEFPRTWELSDTSRRAPDGETRC